MRSTIVIFVVFLAFATTPARAQGTWLETRLIRAVCNSKETSAANTDRLAKRLNLTDPQKGRAEGPGRGFCCCRHYREDVAMC
jgi:hypothetical protein